MLPLLRPAPGPAVSNACQCGPCAAIPKPAKMPAKSAPVAVNGGVNAPAKAAVRRLEAIKKAETAKSRRLARSWRARIAHRGLRPKPAPSCLRRAERAAAAHAAAARYTP